MIDTHAHLNFANFQQDYQEVIKRSSIGGIKAIINVGCQWTDSQRAIQLAKQHPKYLYSAIGLHPTNTQQEEFSLEEYWRLAAHSSVVAIGETGLDYYHLPANNQSEVIALQKKIFLEHLALARKLNLPVIIHCRNAHQNITKQNAYVDLIELLKENDYPITGVIHCFSADWLTAQKFLKLGFYLGFNGPITFKNVSPELLEVIAKIPLGRILTETDSPYLAPEPYRGQRNEPIYTRYIIDKIAQIRQLSFSEIEEITEANARRLFKI
ncbi:MAG: TatD family hydrolase [Candidatus Aenigmarchaeota archaeon]|nr:TatD family hydrolase [Candidatus Aenigmarchaeota archaeon]